MDKSKQEHYFGSSIDSLSGGTLLVIKYCEENERTVPDWLTPKMDNWPRFGGSLYFSMDKGYEQTFVSTFRWYDDGKRLGDFGEAVMFIVDELKGKWWWTVGGKYSGQIVFELEEDAMIFKLRWL